MKRLPAMRSLICTAAVVLALASVKAGGATSLIVNGGFESGFTGWTRVDQLGSEGTFFLQTGTTSPVNADPVPPPPEGNTAAMTDAEGPGSHVLYQDFFVPLGTLDGTLAFDLFIGNRDTDFFTPDSLDFSTPTLNQQARVDILLAGTDPFTVAASDILLNLFQTQPGDPLVSGYNTYVTDVSTLLAANAGKTLRLRFAETDNVFIFQTGVDNVSLEVPEPCSILLLGGGLVAFGARRLRACRSTR